MLAIVDYKAGNLTSVRNAFAALGVEAVVTRDPEVIRAADRIVFPGVGAAKSAMENLRELGLEAAVREAAASGKPFLGICLGMQILFAHTEEDGGVDTLGILPGQVRLFPDVPGFKVPEIGWNQVRIKDGGAKDGLEYYFVHSYYAEVVPETVGFTEYAGVTFTAMVKKGNLWACQFHPEKSGRVGLELLKEWLAC
ncbi:MAG: imidazole glycerol phosphate synthase subunit HisH [bacterium]|nr:imidazole glycerol phosphate synthase subunit HisH [bacterium]